MCLETLDSERITKILLALTATLVGVTEMIEIDSVSETSADLKALIWLLTPKDFTERLFSYKLRDSPLIFNYEVQP